MYNNNALTLPFFPAYWLGARSNASSWPSFRSLDPFAQDPSSTTYAHWGTWDPPFDVSVPEPEPNNKFGDEYCLAANYTQGYGMPFGWGYMDSQCNRTHVPLCKIRPAGSQPLVSYKTQATGSTYVLAIRDVNQSTAEAACNKMGAHLATFASEEEQYEVEQFYISNGYIFPFMAPASYWIGYSLNQTSGNWTGLDLLQPTIDDYNAWGM